ncbi:MAG: hypothetical protein DHS20C07_21800 [Methyloligella sp.]|nr:MAG: hypothetical protein DHS20C07_21800 [Methyloligella sp.]
MKIRQLLYISSQSKKLNINDVRQIVRKSQKRNKQHNVTGLLLYYEGCFCQVIEGYPKDIEVIFDYISNDHKHRSLITLQDDFVDQRAFKEWTMAFQNINHDELTQNDIEEIKAYISEKFNLNENANNFIPIMLHSFIYHHTSDLTLQKMFKFSSGLSSEAL